MRTKLLRRLRRRAKREIGITAKIQCREYINYIVDWRGKKPRHELELKIPFDNYDLAIKHLYHLRRLRFLSLARGIRARGDIRRLNKQFRKL